MRKIAVFTGSRAEYGLLSGLMRGLRDDPDLTLQVIAGAMHYAPEFGQTWRAIVADGFAIDASVEMLLASDTAVGVVKSLGLGTIGMADALARLAPDLLVILGDRFEALAAAQAALILGVPIAHVHGGEITEGAYDDAIRHAITKMATLHFVAAEPYRQRVIRMGTPPDRVFTVGAPGLDGLTAPGPAADPGFALRAPWVLATYHPVTAGPEEPAAGIAAVLAGLEAVPGVQVILTYPNADNGGRAIIAAIEGWAAGKDRVVAVPSLGLARYRTVMRGAAAVVGNSSSGIIEAPSFGVPTVDVGLRQRGRLAATSVRRVDCTAAASAAGQAAARGVVNPYGQGDAAAAMLAVIRRPVPPGLPFHDAGAV